MEFAKDVEKNVGDKNSHAYSLANSHVVIYIVLVSSHE